MANPEHTPDLDAFDIATVRLYRAGLFLAVVGLGLWTVSTWGIVENATAQWTLLASTALAVSNLHLYDKRVRWVIHMCSASGLVTCLVATMVPSPLQHTLWHLGLGLGLVSLSALALKEQFCFRIPGLRAVPLLLAISVGTSWLEQGLLLAMTLAPTTVIFGVLVAAKVRMPLHYDIGDRAHYQN